MGMVTADEAASVLGVSAGNVRRYAAKGLLPSTKQGKKVVVDEDAVLLLSYQKESRDALGDSAQSLFLALKEATSVSANGCRVECLYDDVSTELDITPDVLLAGLQYYEYERTRFITPFVSGSSADLADWVLAHEVRSRFRVQAKNVLSDLITGSYLAPYPCSDDSNLNSARFISFQSVLDHIGARYAGRLLFTSGEVAAKVGVTVQTVCNYRIQKQNSFGFQLNPTAEVGIYLYTLDDVELVRSIAIERNHPTVHF